MHFSSKSDQSLAQGTPIMMVRVVTNTETGVISMKCGGADKAQLETQNMRVFLHVQSARSQLLKAVLSL